MAQRYGKVNFLRQEKRTSAAMKKKAQQQQSTPELIVVVDVAVQNPSFQMVLTC